MNNIKFLSRYRIIVCFLMIAMTPSSYAHDPIFGIGPHVLYKGGVETAIHLHQAKKGADKETELSVEAVYGITGDWAAGIELPYVKAEGKGENVRGIGDAIAFTKYRFWRHDTFGAQESTAVALRIKSATGADALSSGTTDAIAGLTYGYESIKWYRWASVRYRVNDENSKGLQRGNKWLVDIVGGWRPTPPQYREPDTVWLLELNGEFGDNAKLNGITLDNTGGNEWFISPGIFWTKRNFAVKTGIQIPVASHLNGTQEKSDYRASLAFEWHL